MVLEFSTELSSEYVSPRRQVRVSFDEAHPVWLTIELKTGWKSSAKGSKITSTCSRHDVLGHTFREPQRCTTFSDSSSKKPVISAVVCDQLCSDRSSTSNLDFSKCLSTIGTSTHALWPQIVTFVGSPPKAAIFSWIQCKASLASSVFTFH